MTRTRTYRIVGRVCQLGALQYIAVVCAEPAQGEFGFQPEVETQLALSSGLAELARDQLVEHCKAKILGRGDQVAEVTLEDLAR